MARPSRSLATQLASAKAEAAALAKRIPALEGQLTNDAKAMAARLSAAEAAKVAARLRTRVSPLAAAAASARGSEIPPAVCGG